MSCEDIRNLALLAACGEAAPAEAASVREHASRCPACAVEIRALNDGLEILKHVPREAPSRETREALGAMLLREAPVRVAPAFRFWAAAAVALVALSAAVLAWKLGSWDAKKPVDIARGTDKPVVTPTPAPTPAPAPRKATPSALAWVPAADTESETLSTLADAVQEIRGTSVASTAFDRTAVWFGNSNAAVDSFYDTLDEISVSPDKF